MNREKIYAAKLLREKLGGQNQNAVQCSTVPGHIDTAKHEIHLEPCYKQFVRILSDRTHISSVEESSANCSRPKKAKASLELITGVSILTKECNLCKKYRVKRQPKDFLPITISTEQAVTTIKQAAEVNEDQSLYYEIKDLDLIAK